MVSLHEIGNRLTAYCGAMTATLRLVVIATVLIIPGACNDGNTSKTTSQSPMNTLPLDALNRKKFFFQHQSVGNNIIDGIEMLARDSNIPVSIIGLDADANHLSISQNGLAHSRGGKNRFPLTKIDSFVSQIQRFDPEARPDVAFMKFCYIDFNADTDVATLFKHYTTALDQLAKQYPDIRFLHITTPLTAEPTPWRMLINRLLRRFTVADSYNSQRERFNRLLRQRYPEDQIFDLARYESTWPNGKREMFGENNNTYPALVPDYTEDGGHLNESGQRYIAAKFVEFLSRQP